MLGSVLGMMAAPGVAWAITPDGAVSDCTRPASRAERVICADPALLAADRNLASLAAQLRQRVPGPAEAAAAQIDWVRRRDRMCAPGISPDCLQVAYAEREAWLRARLLALPPPAAAPVQEPSPPPASTPQPGPQPAPPALALAAPGVPFAMRLAAAPCAIVSSSALRVMGWSAGDAPFGLPLDQWSKPDFTALARRSAECQAENGDSPRNVQAMATVLERLRAVARDRPATPAASQPPAAAPPQAALPPRQPPAQPAPAPPAGGGEGPLAALNCADPALLQDVSFIFQATPHLSGGTRIQRLSNPRPYTDVIMEAYSATPALRAEYQRLRPYMAPVPQCLVNAETGLGEVVLSYRLYVEGGRPLVEVQRVP
ncbi:hypothetical protein MHZ93_12450 [Roseomonas sp. ACRSG]|nr:hypothetical protein [Roseomonas sp. ACRSG]